MRIKNLKRNSRVPIKMVQVASNTPVTVVPAKKSRRKNGKGMKNLAYELGKIIQERKDTGWVGSTETVVGQVIGSATNEVAPGHFAISITPLPSQGNSGIQREGDSISLTGIYNQFQFSQQANALQPCRGKIIYASPKFSSQNSAVAGNSTYGIETLLNPNPIILSQSSVNVYDTMCSRNQDYMADWKIIRTVNFKIGGDSVSGMKGVKTVRAGIKFKKPHKVHFAPGTTTIISGDIRVFVLFENGNGGVGLANGNLGLTTNAKGVPVKDTLSGWTMCYFSKSYYID